MSAEIRELLTDSEKFIEFAKTAFHAVDADENGSIDIEELEEMMKDIASDLDISAPTKHEVMEVMENIDEDQSGTIDFEEFKVFLREIFESVLKLNNL